MPGGGEGAFRLASYIHMYIHSRVGVAFSYSKVGAKTRLMDGAWWCTTISAPDEAAPRLAIIEKSMPGSCVVNKKGKRIANESQNYMAYQTELFNSHTESRCVMYCSCDYSVLSQVRTSFHNS